MCRFCLVVVLLVLSAFRGLAVCCTDSLLQRNVVADYLEGDSTYWQRALGSLLLKPVPNRMRSPLPIETPDSLVGLTVAGVRVVVLPPFGTSLSDTVASSLSAFERVANLTHLSTLHRVVRRNITLSPGSRIDRFSLYESERLLRSQAYVNDVVIRVVPSDVSPSMADVVVVVQDRFPYAVSANLGSNRQSVSFYNRNILGLGISLGADVIMADGRPGFRLFSGCGNIGHRFLRASLSYCRADSTRNVEVALGRLFSQSPYRLAGRFFIDRSFANLPDSYLSSYEWKRNYNFLYSNMWLGYRWGQRQSLSGPQLYAIAQYIRFSISMFSDSSQWFSPENPDLADSHAFFIAAGLGRQSFVRQRLVYQSGSTEDIPTGCLFMASAGVSFSSVARMPYGAFSAAWGSRILHDGYLRAELSAEVWKQPHHFAKGAVAADLHFFAPLFNLGHTSTRFFVDCNYVCGFGREDGESIGFRGMRQGKPFLDTSIRGTQKLLVSSEAMTFSPVSAVGFRLSFFSFADIGWIAPASSVLLDAANHYSCIGLGVRLRNDRLVLGNIQLKFGIALTHNASNFADLSSQRTSAYNNFMPSSAYVNVFK